ncbi:S-layer homology domain-containing protein [Paenibacillus lactis]|uniref:S-layer homology domain-containing protein n=1 Tax=Paenibacillus lactis TaxID=228574 RepID=UPI002041CCB8|nr:S-layer homology domain-containing protein [Paenibacillus lactis]MCM3492073.1 S-layer homology domain-containing protein [Paenibacillus lactis]
MTTAALLSACTYPVHGASISLNDINQSYAKDAILGLVEQGIINGKGNGKFDPTGKIERQDFAIILAKALKLDVHSNPEKPTFKDVPEDHYAYAFVEAAVKAGLIKGVGNEMLGVGQNLSRQDMAVFLVRALSVVGIGKDEIGDIDSRLKFSDAASIADYAKYHVAAAVELGLMKGINDKMFNPTGQADRQSVALAANRFLKVKEELETPSETPVPTPKPGEETPTPAEKPTQNPTPPTGGIGGGSTAPSDPNPGGNPSTPDTTAPMVRLLSAESVVVGDNVAVTSSETGIVYFVPYSLNASTKAQLESFVADKLANKTIVAAAQTETQIATSNLSPGDYKVYAVDAAGNVSAPSNKIILSAPLMKQPTLHFFDGRSLAIAYEETLNPLFVPNVNEISVYTKDGELRLPQEIRRIEITGQYILVTFAEPQPMARPLEVVYAPLSASTAVRSADGKLSPAFGPTAVQYLPDNVRSLLEQLISSAETLRDNSTPGNTAGTYPPFAFDQLNQAILNAYSAADNPNSTVESLASAYNHLYQQIEAFKRSRLKPLKISLTEENASFVLNSNRLSVNGMSARITDSSLEEDRYDIRNIGNLIKVTRDDAFTELEIHYNPVAYGFEIQSEGETIGHIEIETSDPSLIQLTGGDQGIQVAPVPNVNQDRPVSLIFKVFEKDAEAGKIELPIRFDSEPPTVTGVTYDSAQGLFLFQSAEPVYSYPQTIPLRAQVDYSSNGDFGQNSIDIFPLVDREDFEAGITQDKRAVMIQLTPKGLSKLAGELPGGKFRITIYGMSDFAMNWQQELHIIDAPKTQ